MGSNRPEARQGYVIGGISVFSIAMYCFCMYEAVVSGGNTANWIGGIGVLFIVAGAVCLTRGIYIFKNADYSMRSRIAALVPPIVSLVLWVHLYIMGMLYG